MKNYDFIVIGGCSAGIVAAINAKRQNPNIKIAVLCVDNDEAGHKAIKRIQQMKSIFNNINMFK